MARSSIFHILIFWLTIGCHGQLESGISPAHHHPDGGFVNPYVSQESEPGFKKLMKWF
ncbi:MAG: hypothetical protein K9N34_01475 [Candidatus Marinimicrobia bacterium]|nr:hypothetical protein [Candidatus Neomarinimicrobiota bacterium]